MRTLNTYLPLVRQQARLFADRRVARAAELERYGLIGLKKAIEMFDPDRAIPFEAFARQRIRGAISDYLRTVTPGRTRTAAQPVPVALLRDIESPSTSLGAGVEIWRAIEALPPSQKLVIGLHYCEGVSLKDMGRILEITQLEAQSLRDQALHSVRTHLSLRSWLNGERSHGDAAG